MEFKIIAPGGNELQVFNALPKGFTGKILSLNLSTEVKAAFGNMIFQNYRGNGFDIWYSNYNIQHRTELIGRGNIPVLELHIQFENEFENVWDGNGKKILKPYQYNLSYTPFLDNKARFDIGTHYTFDVHFEISYLQQLSEYFPVLEHFLLLVEKGLPTDISETDRFLSPDMILVVNQILRCPFRNGVAGFYLECKVVELLLLVLDQVSEKHAPMKLSNYDIDMLHEAKKLAIADFENPLSIMQLSRKVGINDFKLKRGFKYLFGTTIFDYVQGIRLEKARRLLLETDLPIEDIAFMTGYEYVPNFNKAFKKRFSYTAAYLRKHRKQ